MVEDNKSIDFWLLFVTLALAGIGLVMVYSSSMYLSLEKIGSGSFYFKKQAVHIIIGIAVMMFLTRIHYRSYAVIGPVVLGFGYLLLIWLLVQNHLRGDDINRWLRLGWISFQPSEPMKVFLIIFLASSVAGMGDKIRDFKHGFLPLVVVIALTFCLVFLQPDLGIAGILLVSGLSVMFFGKAKLLHFLMIAAPACITIVLLVKNVAYMNKRWLDYVGTEVPYQIKQSIIGIGSGGIFGIGLGNSNMKYYFLPEMHTDFVFSIFAEELGLLGTFTLLFLTMLFVLRGFKIARQAPDMFGYLVASGLSLMIGMQVFINIGVAIRLLPTTGMTLPFISYGGSSIVVSFMITGILLNISRYGRAEVRLSKEFGGRKYRRVYT